MSYDIHVKVLRRGRQAGRQAGRYFEYESLITRNPDIHPANGCQYSASRRAGGFDLYIYRYTSAAKNVLNPKIRLQRKKRINTRI